MDYQFQILAEHALVIERISGEVTLEEMIEKTKTLFTHPAYDKHYSRVVDLRNGVPRMTKVELYGFAKLIDESDQFGHAPWAVIAADPMLVALSQVFKYQLKNSDTIGVFSTVAEASRFLRKPILLEHIRDEAVI